MKKLTRILVVIASIAISVDSAAAALRAGAAKIDITDPAAPIRDGALSARALVLESDRATAVILTIDAVAIGEIGPIKSDFLPNVRHALEKELKIDPAHVMVNASHCHGVVCKDVDQRAVAAVKQALANLTPVRVGAGRGREDRIMENRRLHLTDGSQADVRHAYSVAPDERIKSIGPIDPDIGILRIDRLDGRPLALVYNFACHPIMGVPGGGNTADLTGFACKVLEDTMGHDAIALFVQGCAGDINPVHYKDVHHPRDAQTLGNLLGHSAASAWRQITVSEQAPLRIVRETMQLPRADSAQRIAKLQQRQATLVKSLRGTSLDFKNFLPLLVKYKLSPDYPSAPAHAYLHEQSIGRNDLQKLDAENLRNLEQYLANIRTMEELTRVQTNLALLEKHQAQNRKSDQPTIEVELVGLKVGDFALVTFPGELTVQIGLNIKKASPLPMTFVAGYTNGYIYYAPTEEQLANTGCAQEDCDTIVGPTWQKQFEDKALNLLKKL